MSKTKDIVTSSEHERRDSSDLLYLNYIVSTTGHEVAMGGDPRKRMSGDGSRHPRRSGNRMQ